MKKGNPARRITPQESQLIDIIRALKVNPEELRNNIAWSNGKMELEKKGNVPQHNVIKWKFPKE